MSLAPGSRVGPFEIVGPLGAGGMGEVYRARDPRLGRDVAIKGLPEAFARHPERLARFEREAQLLASLNHPNIGALYGLEVSGGSPHLVLELVEGETLAARLARGPLGPREALAVGLQVAAAIEAAHERGIVHRDLKPGNVMITPSGTAKVLDFGLAKGDVVQAEAGSGSFATTLAAAPGGTIAGALVGTIAYMSPEQARGRTVDRRSDLWSFACVLYESYAGRAAFTGETASDLIARILEREPDWNALPATVPPRVREVLRRCLRKDAEERPRDIRDVRLELAEVAAGGERGTASREKSIAVLPFENLSGADDEYFADGITDEILNALAHLEGLRVAARSSCFALKGRRGDPRTVGETLDVAAVLEGSVRRAGNRLRITVQLVNAADGYQLWSERYDREMTDVFAVQDEIAAAIAARLRVSLVADAGRGRGRRGTSHLEAYELTMKGRAYQLRRGRFLRQAIPCFERAIALDPGYAEPLAYLADSYRLMGTFGTAPFAEVMPRARALAERALAIDPDQPEANATLGDVAAQYERDWPKAAAAFARALAADPRHVRSLCERAQWGLALRVISGEQAVADTARAVAEDPLNAWVIAMHSHVLGVSGRHAESAGMADRAVEADPDSFFAQWNAMRTRAWWADDPAQALEVAPGLLAASGRDPWVLGLLAWVHARLGAPSTARAIVDELAARARHEFVSPAWLAVAAGAAGLHEEALRLAERGFRERDPVMLLTRRWPVLEEQKADPRWIAMVKEVWP